ncbi:nuclear factor 7, ovary-like [Ambystoma mexicanum]|uniref:nuclear factor 7, ovary-like n=1 Tax=Ambystoma mexicanum TaxID=8296 RepID=UPI0037E7017F
MAAAEIPPTDEPKEETEEESCLPNAPLIERERAVLDLCEKYEEEMKEIEQNVGQLSQDVSEEFHKLYRFLLREEQTTMARIHKEEVATLTYMEGKVQDLTSLLEDLGENSATDLLLAEFDGKLHQKREEFRCVLFEVMGSLPLQHRVWKRMRRVIQPAMEPLTLDPQTAHSGLILSKNLRAVRQSSRAPMVHTHSKRFEICFYVLALEGFLDGRHYWEVDVGDKTNWTIGVCNPWIGRSVVGSSTGCTFTKDLSPENGYWVLRKLPGERYQALTSKSVVFRLKKSPTRVGVYLDFRNANIGFYDAETMAQMFAFKDDFQSVGKLHPFFGPGLVTREPDYGPLTVCVV